MEDSEFDFAGTGLEKINIPGKTYLRESLTACTDPMKAIENFQVIRVTIPCGTCFCSL